MNRFSRLLDGLAKTRRAIADGLRAALAGRRVLDAQALDRLEETLIAAEIGRAHV